MRIEQFAFVRLVRLFRTCKEFAFWRGMRRVEALRWCLVLSVVLWFLIEYVGLGSLFPRGSLRRIFRLGRSSIKSPFGFQAHSFNDLREWAALYRKGARSFKIDPHWIDRKSGNDTKWKDGTALP